VGGAAREGAVGGFVQAVCAAVVGAGGRQRRWALRAVGGAEGGGDVHWRF